MKKLLIINLILIILFSISCVKDKKNGIFVGRSQSIYKSEPFVGFVKLKLTNGVIDSVDFMIIDTLNNEIFDENYERHYKGNDEYIKQCRNDCNGIKYYKKRLIEVKDINKVNAITGATWSYNIFKDCVNIALKESKK